MYEFIKPLRVASAALALAALITPLTTSAQTAQDVPPNWDEHCRCYRHVSYGPVSWYEPTTRKVARQEMDIFMPPGTPPATGWPVAYYGHPNGSTNFIAMDTKAGSKWSTLVRPLLEQGFIVVSYEFRHPVVNYVEGEPVPRYDIQRAINNFATKYAAPLGADPTNSFIFGRSRGGGLGLLTALTGKFNGGTQIRALWLAQAQTSFDCNEAAETFVLPEEHAEFLASCQSVPGAGSSLKAVRAGSPPVVALYERAFRKELVHAEEADLHFPDFGWQLCLRYQARGESSQCQAADMVPPEQSWNGMAQYFSTHIVR
jgi:acetyl esterase/lipase